MNKRFSAAKSAGLVVLSTATFCVMAAVSLAGASPAQANPYDGYGPGGNQYFDPGYNQGGPMYGNPGIEPWGNPGPGMGPGGWPGPGSCNGPCGGPRPVMGTIVAWNVNGGVMIINQFGVATFAWCPPPPGFVSPCFFPDGRFERWA